MKPLYLSLLLVPVLFLLGCSALATKDCRDCELDLYKAQLDKSALEDKYSANTAVLEECRSDLKDCKGIEVPACPECEKCPVPESCDAADAALSACNGQKTLLTTSLSDCTLQLSSCVSGKSACTDSLSTCNSQKAACEAELAAASDSVPTTLVRHYVRGNLGVVGDYRTTAIDGLGVNYSKVLIGLDYTGGNDTFFTPSVTTDYGLNRIRWYTLTSADGITFNSDIDDTVLIDNGNRLKIKSSEYAAGTSKEGLALRRVIMILIG